MEDAKRIIENYQEHLDTKYRPFVLTKDVKLGSSLALYIDTLLTLPDDSIIKFGQANDEKAYYYSEMVRKIKTALEKKEIDENAPWFEELKEALIRHEIYVKASDKDLKKGKKESKIAEKRIKDMIKKTKKDSK